MMLRLQKFCLTKLPLVLAALSLIACDNPAEQLALEAQAKNQKAVLTASPNSFLFSPQLNGATTTQVLTLTNSGTKPATTFAASFSATTEFNFAGGTYPGTSGTCGTEIAVGDNCTIQIQFSAASANVYSATMALNFNDGQNDISSNINLNGTSGVEALLATTDAPSYDYGNVEAGVTSEHTFTVQNVGVTSATSFSGSFVGSNYAFKGGSFPGTGGTCTATLPALNSCTIVIEFTPLSVAVINATLNLDYTNGSGAQSTPQLLTGTGTAPGPPVLSGLSNDTVPTQSKTWNWTCDKVCEVRFAVNTSPTHTFTVEPWVSTFTATENAGTGTYYIHVEPRETVGLNVGTAVTVSAVVDNSAPTSPSSLALGSDATPTASPTLTWVASVEETTFSHYEIALGTTPGGTEIATWVNIGDVLTHQSTGVAGLVAFTNYYTAIKGIDAAGNESFVAGSSAWQIPGPPFGITNLAITSFTQTSIELGWTAPGDNGSAITDYIVEFKETSSSIWNVFSDGVSTNLNATVTGLASSTSYDFRVKAFNGANGLDSNTATGETAVNDPFFDPSSYKAINLGGATDSAVVAFEDTTVITLNGGALTTLNKGQTHGFVSALNDIVSADKPIFVAGRLGSGAAASKGNMVWSPPAWAGKDFVFTGTRSGPHLVTIYAFEDSNITITQGVTTVATQFVTTGNNHTFSIGIDGGFKMSSDGLIIGFFYSSGGSTVSDPKPLLPAQTDIIGFPSNSMYLTTVSDSNAYNYYHSNSVTASGTANEGAAIQINPQGAPASLYQSEALRIIAATPVTGSSNADSNGLCSAPFLPTSMMRKRYAINTAAEWVAFASTSPGTIDMIEPGTETITTLTLTRSGAEANAPYFARTTIKAAGFRFESTIKFAAWYEPSTDTNGADDDESIMYGWD